MTQSAAAAAVFLSLLLCDGICFIQQSYKKKIEISIKQKTKQKTDVGLFVHSRQTQVDNRQRTSSFFFSLWLNSEMQKVIRFS